MREIRTLRSMSGDRKRGDAEWPEPPRLSSTLRGLTRKRRSERLACFPDAPFHRDLKTYLLGVGG